jgi:hypothetical protein
VKITHHGDRLKAEERWFLRVEHECGACGTRYLLDGGDPVRVEPWAVESLCPVCQASVLTRKRAPDPAFIAAVAERLGEAFAESLAELRQARLDA